MSSVSDAKGPLKAAVQAVIIKSIADYGREGASDLTGIALRTLSGWLRSWGYAPRCSPDVPDDAIRELREFLELPPPAKSKLQVVEIPESVRKSIERATELMLTGQHRAALQELLSIEFPDSPRQFGAVNSSILNARPPELASTPLVR